MARQHNREGRKKKGPHEQDFEITQVSKLLKDEQFSFLFLFGSSSIKHDEWRYEAIEKEKLSSLYSGLTISKIKNGRGPESVNLLSDGVLKSNASIFS
jgi:hypothetical protein